MPTMTIMVGYPGSGKTTYCSWNQSNEIIVSLDDIRMYVYGEEYNKEREYEVYKAQGVMLNCLMDQGFDIIVDSTNTRLKVRAELIELAKSKEYDVVARVMTVSVDQCKKRVIHKGKPHLAEVIDRQSEYFIKPSLNEGFVRIEEIPE